MHFRLEFSHCSKLLINNMLLFSPQNKVCNFPQLPVTTGWSAYCDMVSTVPPQFLIASVPHALLKFKLFTGSLSRIFEQSRTVVHTSCNEKHSWRKLCQYFISPDKILVWGYEIFVFLILLLARYADVQHVQRIFWQSRDGGCNKEGRSFWCINEINDLSTFFFLDQYRLWCKNFKGICQLNTIMYGNSTVVRVLYHVVHNVNLSILQGK